MESKIELQDLTVLFEVKTTSAILNYDAGNFRQCVSDLYFAFENLVKYLLAQKGYFPETHEGVRTLFASHFLRDGRLNKEVYNCFTNLYLRRKDADYSGAVSFDKIDIEKYIGWLVKSFAELKPFFKQTDKMEKIQINSVSRNIQRLALKSVEPLPGEKHTVWKPSN